MSCYMCDKEATSVEHVPPRCLFPEKKDLPEGVDLRKQLITVPSCDEHNTAKSKDDEYLLYLMVINIPSGEIARNHFLTKIMRSIERNPSLINLLMKTQQPVTVVDTKTGEAHETVAVSIDDDRLDSALEHISRAIYFHHFENKWEGEVRTQPDFLLASLDPAKGEELNKPVSELANLADTIFSGKPFYGENQAVFKYQVIDGGDSAHKLMRFHFYEECKVTSVFREN